MGGLFQTFIMPPTGLAAGAPGTYGKCARIWESWERQGAHVAGRGPATDPKGPPDILHHLRDARAGTFDCQAGPETEQTDQKVCALRGHDYRRPGLYPADTGGDGS